MPFGIDQFEGWSERRGKLIRIVAHDRQPAAPFGAVRSESRDDHMTTGTDGLLQATDVRIAVGRLSQKVKSGAIVPEVIRARRLPTGDVRDDLVDPVSAPAEPLFCLLESFCGKVEYCYPAETLREQAINQP